MAYDLTAMRAEVVARGFDYLPTSRIDRFLNDAMHAIEDMERWSWLLTVTTGTGPFFTITDLGRILSVMDTTNGNSLEFKDLRDVIDEFGSASGAGTPIWYYNTFSAGPRVHVYPTASVSLTVNYLKVTPDMSAGSDVPSIPDRFRYAIVEYAVAAALRDVSNYAEAQAAAQAGDVIVQRMRESDLLQQGAANNQVIFGDAGDW